MWRLWTKGWGPKSWWYWFREEGLPLWIVVHSSKRILLWAFIYVYAKSGQSPGDEYRIAYDAWVK